MKPPVRMIYGSLRERALFVAAALRVGTTREFGRRLRISRRRMSLTLHGLAYDTPYLERCGLGEWYITDEGDQYVREQWRRMGVADGDAGRTAAGAAAGD
jgi:hypothetical protein